MSDQRLAQLWDELIIEGDHDRLILEEIGHFELYRTATPFDFKTTYSFFGALFTRLKILFDVQRSRIQSDPSKDCSIPLDLHYAVLLRIVQWGTCIPVEYGSDLSEYLFYRRLLLQTFVSAFRTAMLRTVSLDHGQIQDLNHRLRGLVASWEGQIQQALPAAEEFILKYLLPQTIEGLSDPSMSATITRIAAGEFHLPKSPSGLHPFTLSPKSDPGKSVVLALQRVVKELDSPLWLRAYWALFDVIWAIIGSAFTKELSASKFGRHNRGLNLVDEVLATVFGTDGQWSEFKARIAVTKSLADFYAPYGEMVSRHYESTVSVTLTTSDDTQPWEKHKIETEWDAFLAYILDRKRQMGTLYGAAVQYEKPKLIPLPAAIPQKTQFIEHMHSAPELVARNSIRAPIVIEPIPELPTAGVSVETLPTAPSPQTRQRTSVVGFMDWPQDPENLASRRSSKSPGNASSEFPTPQPAPDTDNASLYPESVLSSPGIQTAPTQLGSPIITREPSLSSESSTTGKRSRFWGFKPASTFFGSKPLESSVSLTPADLNVTFSHSGKSLFFWKKHNCDFIIWSDLLHDQSIRCSLASGQPLRARGASVKFVSASDNALAILAHYQDEGDKLFHFSDKGVRREAEGNTYLGNRGADCTSCAISPDGTMIALGWGLTVQLYKHDGTSLSLFTALLIHESHSGAVARYQRVSFCPESKKLVTATQELVDAHKHAIYIRIWNCMTDSTHAQWRPQGNTVTVGYGDDTGVTSVFFDPTSMRALMTANLSKSYYAIIGMNGYRAVLEGLSPRNIDLAAQGPSHKHFALKTAKLNRIHLLDLGNGELGSGIDLDLDRKGAKQEVMALAMPEHDLVLAVGRVGSAYVLKRLKIVGNRVVHASSDDLGKLYQRGLAASV